MNLHFASIIQAPGVYMLMGQTLICDCYSLRLPRIRPKAMRYEPSVHKNDVDFVDLVGELQLFVSEALD